MTKVSIKVISVILCAVMVVGCCFVGCRQDTILTLSQLLDEINEYFPEAHINTCPNSDELYCIFFYKDEERSPFLDAGINKNNIDTKNISRSNFELHRLKSKEDIIKILNTIMPNFINGWNENDSNSFVSIAKPNADFTEWENSHHSYEVADRKITPVDHRSLDSYRYEGLSVFVFW